MKRFSLILPALAMVLFFSCKPKEDQKMETPALPSADFNVVVGLHGVKDFDKWKSVYTSNDSIRASMGMTHLTTGRGKEDANMVFVANKIAEVDKVKAFFAAPETRARMDSAGTTNPVFHYIQILRWDTATVQGKDRAFVSFKVKDFDTWLKVFDAEGRDTRASNGFGDRAIGRGIEDPNTVYLAFYVADPAKMTAFMQSEEFKKIKADSGFEGEPNAFMYTAE